MLTRHRLTKFGGRLDVQEIHLGTSISGRYFRSLLSGVAIVSLGLIFTQFQEISIVCVLGVVAAVGVWWLSGIPTIVRVYDSKIITNFGFRETTYFFEDLHSAEIRVEPDGETSSLALRLRFRNAPHLRDSSFGIVAMRESEDQMRELQEVINAAIRRYKLSERN